MLTWSLRRAALALALLAFHCQAGVDLVLGINSGEYEKSEGAADVFERLEI